MGRVHSVALLAVIAAFAAVGLRLQWATHLNHDIAWLLYSTGRMIEGAVFGRDIIAANPPLAWFISMPTVLVSNWFDWPVDAVFRGFITLVAVLALAHCCWTLRTLPPLQRFAIIATLAYLLFVGSNRDFGQREHLSLILALPYLASTAARIDGRHPTWIAAILIGVAAGIGFALKPYFLAVPFLVEAALLLAQRTPRILIRPEMAAMVATGLLYALAVLFITPEYVINVVPLVSEVYWGFGKPVGHVVFMVWPSLVGFAVAACLALAVRPSAMPTVFLAAALGYAVSYFVQFKGYTYHALPMNILVTGAIILQLFNVTSNRISNARIDKICRVAGGLCAMLLLATTAEKSAFWYWVSARPDGKLARQIDEVIDVVNSYAANDSFLAISTHPFPGFPTAIYVESAWAGRTNSQIALPAVIKLREQGTPANAAIRRQSETLARTMLLEDLSKTKPALLLVDARERRHAIGKSRFDILEFYLGDPAIEAVLRDYEELPKTGGFRVFVRKHMS